jgi:hypothetical protein
VTLPGISLYSWSGISLYEDAHLVLSMSSFTYITVLLTLIWVAWPLSTPYANFLRQPAGAKPTLRARDTAFHHSEVKEWTFELELELARDPPHYDSGDESIDISCTISHYPSKNASSPRSSRAPVPIGTVLQAHVTINGHAAGYATFPALHAEEAYKHSDPTVGGPHSPRTMMTFLNLAVALSSFDAQAAIFLC